jgi:glutaconate CoA-transferase, subunit A
VLAQLRAAEMGLPFLPVRGVLGSDMPRLHPEYKEVTCPFTGERLVAVPAIRPDVVLLHAPLGDRRGNLHLDQPYVLDERLAGASRNVVATVERVASTGEVAAAGIIVPAHLVAAVAEVPFGAHPTSCYPDYPYDRVHLAGWVAAAGAGEDAVAAWLDRYVLGVDEEGYRKAVGGDRLLVLRGWSASTEAWKELLA